MVEDPQLSYSVTRSNFLELPIVERRQIAHNLFIYTGQYKSAKSMSIWNPHKLIFRVSVADINCLDVKMEI